MAAVLLLIAAIAAGVGIWLLLQRRVGVPTANGNDNAASTGIDFNAVDDVGVLIPADREDPAATYAEDPATTIDVSTMDAATEAAIDSVGERFLAAWQGDAEVDAHETFDLRRMLWEIVRQAPPTQRKTFRYYWSLVDKQRGSSTAEMFSSMLASQLDTDRQRRAGQLDPLRIERFRTLEVPGRPELITWWRVVPRERPVRRFALGLIRGEDGTFRVYDVLDQQTFIRFSAQSMLVRGAQDDLAAVTNLHVKVEQVAGLVQRLKDSRLDVPLIEIDRAIGDPDLQAWRGWLQAARIKQMMANDAPAADIIAEGNRLLIGATVNPTLYIWLGQFRYQLGDFTEAATLFGKYLEITGPDETISAIRGRALSKAEREPEARECWQAWIDIAPRPGVCHMDLAQSFRAAKQPADATPLLAALLMTERSSSWVVRAELDALIDGLAGPDGAAAVKQMIAAMTPADERPADILLYLGRAHAGCGEIDDALRVLAFFLSRAADDPAVPLDAQQSALLDLLDLEQPRNVAAAQEWLAAYPQFARSESHRRILLAELHAGAGDLAAARSDLEAARAADAGCIRWLVDDTRKNVCGTRELWAAAGLAAWLQEWHTADTGAAFELPPAAADDTGWRRRSMRMRNGG